MLSGFAPTTVPCVVPLSGSVSTRSVPSNSVGSAAQAALHRRSRSWFDASSVHIGGGICSDGPPQLLATAGYEDVDAEDTTLIPLAPPSAATLAMRCSAVAIRILCCSVDVGG